MTTAAAPLLSSHKRSGSPASATDGTDSQMARTSHNANEILASSRWSKLSLEQTFPAILTPVHLFHRLENRPNVDNLCSLAQVFVHCLGSIIDSMDQLPYGVRLDSTYEMAREGVLFTQYLFTAQVAQVDAHLSGFRLKEAYQIALQLMDMTMASLKSFFEVAERILKRKTLPNPPTDTIVNVDSEDEHDLKVMDGVGTSILPKSEGEKKPTLPPASITEESATTTVVADDNQESCLSSTGMRDGVPTALSSLARRARMITRLLACAGSAPTRFNANATEYTLTTNECADDSVRSVHLEAKSQMGPVSPPGGKRTLQNDNTSESQKSPKRNAYSIRQSLLVFSDPEEPQNNVEMPRPVGDAFDININEKGVIVGASLSALIRILTSKDAVTDHELTEMFFVCFRFFSSPMEVYDKLVGRYDEQPPGPLTTSQSRVWEQEARLVRFRVAKVFLMWLDLHWRHETDKDVFEPLLNFTFKRMAADLPFELSKKITEALHKCAGTGHNYRGRRLRRRLEMQENVLKSEVPPSTSFKLSKATDRGGSSTLEVLDFNSTRGRQELAIQLTINASQLYRLVDPEDAIIFWRNGENKEVGRTISDLVDFEKSICFFVTNSILDRAGPAARAAMAGFWIDVASRCVRLRNFSTGASILAGIRCPSIDRLIHTVTYLSRPHQMQYKVLCRLFCLFSNLRDYRAALRSSEMPAVPLLSSLIHDIRVIKEVRPSGNLSGDIGKPVINISSYRVVTKTLRAMELCHISYKLTCIDYIQDWLASALKEYAAVLDDAALADQFLDRSFALEAKDVDWTDMTWLKVIQYYEEETETKQVETGWKSRFSFKFLSSTSLRS